ncbi:DUF6082 family protein [Streptomyces sp. NPDC051135]|uniref:DUF6082 family protein n=1 Tax=unclassified Streptomyces TaxID=2593676 RepID=UPI00343B04B5
MVTRKNVTGRFGSAAAGVLTAARQRRLARTRLDERELRLEESALRREAMRHQQRMHWELLTRAINDPSLAEVIDTYDKSIPAARRRQFLYANAWYTYLYHCYRAGLLDREELYRTLREFFQSPVFREYWGASAHMRASLNEASEEARLGRMVDGLVQDLDEADTDEWWVVGTPPTD